MLPQLMSLLLLSLALSSAWGQNLQSNQCCIIRSNKASEILERNNNGKRLSEPTTVHNQEPLSLILDKFKRSAPSPQEQLNNLLIRKTQPLNIMRRDGGNISGGGDEGQAFIGSENEAKILKSFQIGLLGLTQIHSLGYAGKGVRVAILDSGISDTLASSKNVVQFVDFTSRCSEKSYCDESGHGSKVADLVLQGAPNADLIVLKTLSYESTGKFSDLNKALIWILENHKKLNIRVINLSLTSPEQISGSWNEVDTAREIVRKLDEEGLIIVSASGNSYKNRIDLFPASSPNILTVGSYSHEFSDNPKQFIPSFFSNLGFAANPKVEKEDSLFYSSTKRDFNSWILKPEVLAPGENLLVGEGKLQFITGTSYASALVSGGIASMISLDPLLNRKSLLEKIHKADCALPAIDLNGGRQRVCAIKFDIFPNE